MRPSACRRGNAVPAAIVVTVLVAAALVARVPADAHGARSAERSVGAPAQATAVTVVDDFEDPDWPDPDLWRLVVDEDAEYTWGPRTCRASSGTRSLWAVGGGALGGSLRCRSSYPAGVASRAVVELDLGPYASARPLELAFDIASDQLSDSSRGDFLSVIYRRPDPEVELERVPVIEWTGSTGPSVPFQTWRIDLRNVVDRYDDSRRWDVAGGKAEFEFQFTSGDDSSDRGEGPHIDRLRLEYGGIPQVVPTPRTPRPTRTPTPTATSTPTITPTPSRTPTVTATPIDRRHLSLPYLLRRGAQPPKQQVEGLVIVAEPERPTTLYRFGTTSRAAADVLGALYDDPVDLVGYEPRASILSSLPRPGDEGLRARTVSVEVGERYVDPSTGEVRSATERLSGLVQLRVKFELLPSLAWEDGVPVTADDAVLGHRLACDPSSPPHPWSDACSRTASVTRLDERSIEWQGIPGFGDPSYLAVVIPPMPRHQRSADGRRMESMTAAEVAADPNFRWRPLSYGPFRLTGWAGPDRAALVPNEHYWRSAELLPYLEQLVFDFHRDAAGAVAQFAAGRADVVGPFRPTAPAELGVPEIARPHVVIAVPGPEWVGLVFDVAPADDRPAWGACLAVRQAVALAADRSAVARLLGGEASAALDALVPASHWAHPPAGGPGTWPRDPARAQEALESAGFTRGPGGVRRAARDVTCEVLGPDGRPAPRVIPAGTDLAIRIAHAAGDDVVRAVADRIARDLAQIGIAATAEGLPADRLAARSPDGVLAGRRFDVALVERRFGVVPGVGDLTCGAIPSAADGYAGANVGGWCDPELDALVRASRTAVDKAAAATAYGLAMRRAGESLPLLPLAPRSRLALAAPWVGRLALDPSATAITWNVEHWRIEGDRP